MLRRLSSDVSLPHVVHFFCTHKRQLLERFFYQRLCLLTGCQTQGLVSHLSGAFTELVLQWILLSAILRPLLILPVICLFPRDVVIFVSRCVQSERSFDHILYKQFGETKKERLGFLRTVLFVNIKCGENTLSCLTIKFLNRGQTE